MADSIPNGVFSRARGCLIGQVSGDSLGSLVEFSDPPMIELRYPGGPRLLEDGGVWGTIAGQPTDDSEMAITLARTIIARGGYDEDSVARAYVEWMLSQPFDIGGTTRTALQAASSAMRRGLPPAAAARAGARSDSQANGSLMRCSPLAVFSWNASPEEQWNRACADASITHIHPVCRQATAVFVTAVAFAVRRGEGPQSVYSHALSQAKLRASEPTVIERLEAAATENAPDFLRQMGWVLTAFHNAFYQLLHAPGPEEGVIDTVRRGGDTDTTGAIAGALLGAVHGIGTIPKQWVESVCACRPAAGRPRVLQPRPEFYWPADVFSIAEDLVRVGAA